MAGLSLCELCNGEIHLVYKNILPQQNKAVNTPKLKTYAELNCSALKNKLDKSLVIYYQLRALNNSGSGFIPFKLAIKELQKVFRYNQATTYRIISEGQNIFYEYCKSSHSEKIIRLYSLQKVTANLGIKHLSIPTLIDVNNCKKRQEIRGWLYNAIYKNTEYNKPIHPMSHKTIEEKTGIKTLQQQRYNKVTNVKVTPNFANEPTIYSGKSRQYITAKQLGNSYVTKLEKGHKGNIKKINRYLKKELSKPSLRDEANDTKTTLRFYHAIKDVKGIFGETYFLDKYKTHYNLWSRI